MLFFFFFQAEDGIRDDLVTGVQTCALPICFHIMAAPHPRGAGTTMMWKPLNSSRPSRTTTSLTARTGFSSQTATRSEERRVGKECRCRLAPDHTKENHEIRLLI